MSVLPGGLGREHERRRVLVVEDVDLKFEDVMSTTLGLLPDQLDVTRAHNVVEVEDKLSKGPWDLLILDISMDISRSSGGRLSGGHANLGGMDVVEQMYLLEQEVPTIIITGFDYFPSAGQDTSETEMVSLDDLHRRAHSLIGDHHLGTVRYGSATWRKEFASILSNWATS